MKKVLIIMGSDSDLPRMEACLTMLERFKVPYEAEVCSAHRSPERAAQLSSAAERNGFGVIICAAGLAAHLPGVIAASTILPVIGIPVESGALSGLDALYAIVQMPSGVPVACVAINGAANAAVLAVQILASSESSLIPELHRYKAELQFEVEKKNAQLQERLNERRKDN